MRHRGAGIRAAAAIAAVGSILTAAHAGAQQPRLGPVDGKDLPAVDTGRVVVGAPAPDFTLESKDGGVVRLSQYRGRRNVVLVFYRGHW